MKNIHGKLKKILTCLIFLFFIAVSFIYAQDIQTSEVVGSPVLYTAKSNTSFFDIARKYNVAIDHIMMANMTGATTVKQGKEIIVPTFWIAPVNGLTNALVLNLPERAIYVYKNSKVISVYPVAIGALGWNTPTGKYSIAAKTKNPTWFPPAWANIGHPVYPGPHNPLGDRWMGLSINGYGIHATNAPTSIGLAASHGCIRMYPESARALFEEVYVGMPIHIVYETIKVGFDPRDGKLYLSVFPDIYGYGTNGLSNVKNKFAKLGVENLVDEKTVSRILKEKRGMPQVVLGSDYIVKVGGEKMNMPVSPIIKDKDVFVCDELFKGLGFEISYNSVNKTLDLARGIDFMTISLASNTANINNKELGYKVYAARLNGYNILPLKLINELGYSANILDDQKTLAVTTLYELPLWTMESNAAKAFASFESKKDEIFFKKKVE